MILPCGCPPPAPETFWTLFHDAAHWKFELFVGGIEELVTGVLIGMFVWPRIQKHWKHHIERDKKEGKNGDHA